MKITELTKKDMQEFADEAKCYLDSYELIDTKIYATLIAKNTRFKIDLILTDFDCKMNEDYKKGGEAYFKTIWQSFMFRRFASDNEFILKWKKYVLKSYKAHNNNVGI